MLSDDELKRYRELLNAQNDSTYFKKEIGANLKNARANTPLKSLTAIQEKFGVMKMEKSCVH